MLVGRHACSYECSLQDSRIASDLDQPEGDVLTTDRARYHSLGANSPCLFMARALISVNIVICQACDGGDGAQLAEQPRQL